MLNNPLGPILGYLFRLIGVVVLYSAGVILNFFKPSAKTFTLKQIYEMDFGKKQYGTMNLDKTNQQLTGFLFVVGVVILYSLVKKSSVI